MFLMLCVIRAHSQIVASTGNGVWTGHATCVGYDSHKAVEKTNEIGIRKGMSAPLSQIGILLLLSTFNQAVIAFVISAPLAYYFCTTISGKVF